MAASKLTDMHTHMRNAVRGLLRLAPKKEMCGIHNLMFHAEFLLVSCLDPTLSPFSLCELGEVWARD